LVRDLTGHAADCGECSELLVLATLPVESGLDSVGFVDSVVARTSGAACERSAPRLAELVDGSLEPGDRALILGHVDGCANCRGLVATLAALAIELPRLAHVRPDEDFVNDVLRRTLPVHVQLRRWWKRTWPRWLRRPRFATEAAYVGLLVLVLVFATPGSPLEAVPRRALALPQQAVAAARQPASLDGVLADSLRTRVAAVREKAADDPKVEAVAGWIAAGAQVVAQADERVESASKSVATFWRDAASLLGNDGEDAVDGSTESQESNEEKP